MRAYLSTTQIKKINPQNVPECSDSIQNDAAVARCESGAAVVLCAAKHAARFYPTGAAQTTEPCSHWRRRRVGGRKEEVWFDGKERSNHSPLSH